MKLNGMRRFSAYVSTIYHSEYITVFVIITIVLTAVISPTAEQNMQTFLCAPFIDPTDTVLVIKILTWLVAVWQIIASFLISIVYICLISSLKKMERNDFIITKKIDKNVISQLVLVTVSDMVGWFSSSVIFIALLLLPRYPKNLPVWTTATIVPLDSIINPFLFIYFPRSKYKIPHRVLSTKEMTTRETSKSIDQSEY